MRVAIEIIGNVAKLDRLRNSVLTHAGIGEMEGKRTFERWRWYERILWHVQVFVILCHADKTDIWATNAIEEWKIIVGEGLGDFEGAIGTEIDVNHGVAVVNCADWLAVVGNNKGRHVLVLETRLFFAISFDGFGCIRELAAFAKHMGAPTLLNHAPVVFVAVASNDHATTAARDAIIRIAQIFDKFFDALYIPRFAIWRNIAAVNQDMQAHALDICPVRLIEHFLEVSDI